MKYCILSTWQLPLGMIFSHSIPELLSDFITQISEIWRIWQRGVREGEKKRRRKKNMAPLLPRCSSSDSADIWILITSRVLKMPLTALPHNYLWNLRVRWRPCLPPCTGTVQTFRMHLGETWWKELFAAEGHFWANWNPKKWTCYITLWHLHEHDIDAHKFLVKCPQIGMWCLPPGFSG